MKHIGVHIKFMDDDLDSNCLGDYRTHGLYTNCITVVISRYRRIVEFTRAVLLPSCFQDAETEFVALQLGVEFMIHPNPHQALGVRGSDLRTKI